MTLIKRFNRLAVHTLLPGRMLLAVVSLTVFPAQGKTGDENRMKINISGTVIATGRCTFSNQSSPDINFGDIRFSSVSGVNNITGSYIRPLDSGMACTGDTAGKTRFRLDSAQGDTVDDAGHKLLPVSVGSTPVINANLGIRLLVNGKQQDINTDFNVDILNLPKLQAELVQVHPDDNTWVNGQSITSQAILTMTFD